MAEHDNAGFPLSYCLLTTATAINPGRRKIALTAWVKCIRDKYEVKPVFTHVDKDMAEIGALKTIWNSKISLCWWHLRRAVRTRLGKTKLATTPYDAKRAHEEFDFIESDFIPPGTKIDLEDYEGGLPEDTKLPHTAERSEVERPSPTPQKALGQATNSLRIRLPPSSQVMAVLMVDDQQKENVDPIHTPNAQPRIHGNGFVLALKPSFDESDPSANSRDRPTCTNTNDTEGDSHSADDENDHEKHSRRIFCPPDSRQPIIDMMERHYCAHPSIPGYAAPNRTAIKLWAVHQMYRYCTKNELPEVWAYLWENWYRKGRWELWARSVHEMIPVLKTTMILESQSVIC